MSHSTARTANVNRQTPAQFALFTLVAATSAALATWGAATLSLKVWAMFAGFIAWFTRPTPLRAGVSALVCLWLGMGLAAVAARTTGALTPAMGALALPVVVFLVASIVVALRTTRVVDNMLAWFLGMVAFFAAEPEPLHLAFAHLGGAAAIGALAGWTCQTLNQRWTGA